MQPIIACNEGISLPKNVAQAHLELGTSLPMSNGGRIGAIWVHLISFCFPCSRKRLAEIQLAFNSEKRFVSEGKDEPIQRTQAASSGFVCLDPRRMASAKMKQRKAQFLSNEIGLDVFQKALEFWFARKAFPRARNIGIQDQRTRPGSGFAGCVRREANGDSRIKRSTRRLYRLSELIGT